MDRLKPDGNYGWIVFLVVIVCAAGIAGMLGYRAVFIQNQIDENKKSRVVQCIQERRLARQVARTQKILDRTKGQRFVFKTIPRALIAQGQRDDRADLKAYRILHCKEQR